MQTEQDRAKPETKLQMEQLKLTLRNLKPNIVMMPAFAAVACVIFARWTSLPDRLTWFTLVVFGVLVQAGVAALFARRQPPVSETRKWIGLCAAAFLVFALAWASMGFFLWVPHDIFNNMLVLLVLGCTLAGSAAVGGACRPLGMVGYVVYGATMIFLPLHDGGEIYYGVTAMAVFYVLYMGHVARTIHRTARDMLLLRDDKNELIEALARSKTDSDAARERAEAASLAKSQFLANMSHELRTPLNAILGFSEMIESGRLGKDPNRHIEYAHLIHESGHHLLALINDILDLAKIEAGRLQLREKPMNLKQAITDNLRLMAEAAAAGGIKLSAELAADLPDLFADERAIKQILLNLLSNAVKFTPPGGTVRVFARIDSDGAVSFGVSDTGVGIAEGDQARVFETFGQGRHDVVTMDKGTGLGLAIVKGLVAAHGGNLNLASRVGEGTCVTVHLPAARSRPPEPVRAAS